MASTFQWSCERQSGWNSKRRPVQGGMLTTGLCDLCKQDEIEEFICIQCFMSYLLNTQWKVNNFEFNVGNKNRKSVNLHFKNKVHDPKRSTVHKILYAQK